MKFIKVHGNTRNNPISINPDMVISIYEGDNCTEICCVSEIIFCVKEKAEDVVKMIENNNWYGGIDWAINPNINRKVFDPLTDVTYTSQITTDVDPDTVNSITSGGTV